MPDLPAPLPPGERTMGQLVAETIRLSGHVFWKALPLGLVPAVADQLSIHETLPRQMAVYWGLTPLFAAAYLWACHVVHRVAVTPVAAAVAVAVWLPFPALRALFVLPGIAWLALFGLGVPAAMVERLGFREALTRGRRLGLADYAHALGSLAALVFVVGASDSVLSALLHTQGSNGQRVALFLSDLVLGPLLFLGGALLYLDQAARGVGSRRADLHPALDPDAAGRPDPQVEP